jgi:hypothetical protein
MNKIFRTLSDISTDIGCYALMGAFTFTCVGALIWSFKWVLSLLEVI